MSAGWPSTETQATTPFLRILRSPCRLQALALTPVGTASSAALQEAECVCDTESPLSPAALRSGGDAGGDRGWSCESRGSQCGVWTRADTP